MTNSKKDVDNLSNIVNLFSFSSHSKSIQETGHIAKAMGFLSKQKKGLVSTETKNRVFRSGCIREVE